MQRDAVPHATGIFFKEELLDFNEWIEKNSQCASYTHFDYKISLKDIINEIVDPQRICRHAFKPFIHFQKEIIKYNGKESVTKIRELNYASHYDRCIYQYYSHLLNEKYNEEAKNLKINHVAIAYRNILKKSNINFAKQAFDFIKSHNGCIVMVADFTNFFDTLDHNYLKLQICKVLKTEKLPEDYYKVFKSVTRYSFVEKEEIDQLCKDLGIKENKKIIMPMSELRNHSKYIKQNKKGCGIPQGVAISSILSNIYMMDFDRDCQNMIRKMGGLYLRYSDDSIFIFPNKNQSDAKYLFNKIIREIQKIPNLELSKTKTKVYYCDKGIVRNCNVAIGNESNSKNAIDYLGFTYDGKYIKIREKTISKYYYRAYKKVKGIKKSRRYHPEQRTGTTNLYDRYTLKGAHSEKGNFLSYVERSARVFNSEDNIKRILKVHYGKIKKRMRTKTKGNQ